MKPNNELNPGLYGRAKNANVSVSAFMTTSTRPIRVLKLYSQLFYLVARSFNVQCIIDYEMENVEEKKHMAPPPPFRAFTNGSIVLLISQGNIWLCHRRLIYRQPSTFLYHKNIISRSWTSYLSKKSPRQRQAMILKLLLKKIKNLHPHLFTTSLLWNGQTKNDITLCFSMVLSPQ